VTARLLKKLLLACLALALLPATALAVESPIEITNFDVTRYAPGSPVTAPPTPGGPEYTQAGGHPNTNIYMQFCGGGFQIANATNTSPVVITTAEPHGIPPGTLEFNQVARVIGVNGNLGANGVFFYRYVSPTEIEMFGSAGTGDFTNGGTLFLPAYTSTVTGQQTEKYGCSPSQAASFLKDFTLKLPPGMLGSPTSVPACPTHLWLAGSCPDNTQLGHAIADTIPSGTMFLVKTSVFNLQTLGWEPARLGTEVVPGIPPGPLPNTVTLRSAPDPGELNEPNQQGADRFEGDEGDYGITSYQINIPKELGGNLGKVRSIDIVLCAYVPCRETMSFVAQSVVPDPSLATDGQVRPFFVNPTSCGTKTVRLESRSYSPPPAGQDESFEDWEETDLPVTGCGSVPFTPDLHVTPTDNKPGASDRQTISIDYPDYADDPIWQGQLKDADTILPQGMGLAPGGGNDLRSCSYEEFGVAATPPHKQLDNLPDECPEGSHVGDIEVETPVLPAPIGGQAFFGPTGNPGRPTDADPWKLFLLLEGQGVRLKLVGDVTLSPSGQVRTLFLNNPETPFTHFRLKMGTRDRAVLLTPLTCETRTGSAPLTSYSGAARTSTTLSVTPDKNADGSCPSDSFQPNIDVAEANPEQAGAHSVSHIVISRPDGQDMLKGLKLSLPPGAAGSLTAVPKCPLGDAQAGNCPESTVVGNIKTSLGSSDSLFTVPGKLYLAEPAQPGDVASIVATVPAKAGVPDPVTGRYPIDLGPDVVIINRLLLREADTGVDVILAGAYRGGQLISDGIPTLLEGVGLPIRKIDITVDREGFFLNPTGCDPRPVVGTFTSEKGITATSSYTTQAKGCERLPFDPTLYMIVGEAGKTRAGQDVHPPLTAIVTQKAGEAAISRAQVYVPDIVRPNVPFLNEPGALCNDAQAATRTCPPKSLVGSARVITPVLPFELRGPVHIVQEAGQILPKLYVYLRGGGFEVLLKARNRIKGVRTENTFDFVPDVPQSYFELKIEGGEDGLLNNFFDLCTTPVDSKSRRVEATFNGHNGAVRTTKFPVRVEGCGSQLAAARIASARIKVNRKGIAKVKVSCRRKDSQCRGRLSITAKGLSAAKSFRIPKRKARTVQLKFSKGEVRRLRKAKRKQMKGRATTKVGSSSARRSVTLVYKRR
jgi:hypothetical protein